MSDDTSTSDTDWNEWDARWVRICEMPLGPDSGFEEFVETVTDAMEETGNEVGRPLVMKVSIDVISGELNRPGDDDQEIVTDGGDTDDDT